MTTPAMILVVDDVPRNVKLLADILSAQGYAVITAASGTEALQQIEHGKPDLVLLDVLMPGMDGYEVCRRIRSHPATTILPVVMVTALDPASERLKGLEAGADDFLTKPVNHAELLARVRSLVRIKSLFQTIEAQKIALEEWSEKLAQRVDEQLRQLESLGRLRRFLSPQVAELILSSGDNSCFQSRRRLIATVFCDLRNFTAFTEAVEPEEAMGVLQIYHKVMDELIDRFEGAIDHRAGDGIMVIFNDPLPCERPAARAVQMALSMRERMQRLAGDWRQLGYELGFGIGISLGYATLGVIGSQSRFDYTAIGNTVNLASRLCDEARSGQILISQRVYAEVQDLVAAEPVTALSLKGFHRPVAAFNVLGLTDSGA